MSAAYSLFTAKEIKPRGWLARQLKLQAEGQGGQLDKFWPDVKDSMWIGGDREGWERVPYWLDGFVPLAYLLDDEDMKARAKRYIDKILEFQRPDGWICPNGDVPIEQYDHWAILLIAKILTVYYDCSGDGRIPSCIYRIMKNLYELLSSERIRLFDWGKHRWFEGFIALNFLAKRYPDEAWIPALARLLKEQGTDYEAKAELWKTPMYQWTQDTHIVNLTMMLKSEAVSCELLGEEYTDLAERLERVLRKYNGTSFGGFTGDECLGGLSPIRGTELCSIVEQMYSYELLYAYTGDKKWAERLEKLAFNALPATISDDMWTHQYVQMSNQIACVPNHGRSPFGTNSTEAHVFGLEPHFGCCTANHGQGWPKLTISSFMKAEDGIVSAVPIPSELKTEWRGVPVTVTLDTDYPFRHSFVYRVEATAKTDMALTIRIPSFAKNLTLNGHPVSAKEYLTVHGFEAGVSELRVHYDVTPKLVARPHRLYAAEYGSLLFALPIETEWVMKEYEKKGVERKFPYCDYRLMGHSDWNVAFCDRALTAEERPIGEIPFSAKTPAVVLKTNLCHIDWGFEKGYDTVCAEAPTCRKPQDEGKTRELIPYGGAKLRMTEIPLVSRGKSKKP